MLIMTTKGLFCPYGDFYIDPTRGVENAVISHAHSDHARRGSQQYFTPSSGVEILKARLGKNIRVRDYSYAERFKIGEVMVSFHPAGHILGSAQIRLERSREVWVVSGDYKRDLDPTCEPFEVVPCDVFITEATFGTPAYQWKKDADLGREIYEWWSDNSARGVNSVLFAYSLGKAQRILGALFPFAKKRIFCHPETNKMNDCYRNQGISLAATECLSRLNASTRLYGDLLLVPQSFLNSEQASVLGSRYETAFASGWMAKGSDFRGYDRGFVMSDHADWNDLLRTIVETGARRVYVQHRGHGALVRQLRKMGLSAYPDTELRPLDTPQMELFP